ncbi:MAG: M48 family metallopeptidase [Candidatus Omnitrophica bacterium]|nr:M48 family metallopeptidase [Candidatus Omnitrophota bacterium]
MPNKNDTKTYNEVKHWMRVIGLALNLAVFAVFHFSGATFWLTDVCHSLTEHRLAINSYYIIFFMTGFTVMHLPLSFFSGYLWEHRFNLSNQNILQWGADELKKFGLGVVLFLVLGNAVFYFLGRDAHDWWIWAGGFWLLISFVIAKLTPNVLVPIFYKYSDLGDEHLKGLIQKLFNKCSVALKNVYKIDMSSKTNKANAFVCGMGKGRRVVLSDTLVEDFTAEEIEVVVAHELGHYKHHDILKLFALNALLIFSGLYFVHTILGGIITRTPATGYGDISLLPLFFLLLTVFNLGMAPAINFLSRVIERQADAFSLKVTQNRDAFISTMQKLADMNMEELTPPQWVKVLMYDHPTIYDRIKFAKEFNL